MDAMIRRRMMMAEAGGAPIPPVPPPAPILLYENTSPVTSSTDTGVKLFDPVIDWTILCDATCNVYNWSTTSHYEGIFGLNPNSQIFRLGKANTVYAMNNGMSSSSTGNYYYALSMYKSEGTPKCIALYSRYNGNLRRQVALRYNSTTKKLEGVSTAAADFSKWYIVDDVPQTSSNVILLVGGISATIHDIQIYQGLMDDADMLAYVQ